MALRAERGAGDGRAALGRARFVGLACALFAAAAAVATWPALRHANESFLARAAPGYGQAAPGDHLQTGYNLWLVGHQLGRGDAPWRDPYSFQPEADRVANLLGWLFGLPYWPLDAAFGPIVAWNLFVLLSYVLAGGAACAWLRELGVGRIAAVAGGLAFALAPYRVAQSTGHLLGPISALLPVALWAFERSLARAAPSRWLVLGGAALTAIPLSGQVHLALGAIPFFAAYALVRTRRRTQLVGAGVGALAAIAAGLLVRELAIAGSISSGGRSLGAVRFYSADWADLVSRHVREGLEQFVFLGWITPLVALAGLAALLGARRLGLGLLLALGALVPILLALGTNLPTYELLWNSLPPFRYPRVPERLMPIACLALAALVAFAIARIRIDLVAQSHKGILFAALAVGVLVVDLRVELYGSAGADERNAAYAALRRAPSGRLLELPVFRPDLHYGSVYLHYAAQAPRERPGGYSTVAPRPADRVARQLRGLGCGAWTRGREHLLAELGVRYVAVHGGLYAATSYVRAVCEPKARRALVAHGFRELARDGSVTLYERRSAG